MYDSTMQVIAIIIVVIIMGGLPLIIVANQMDKTISLSVKTITTEFVNNIRRSGSIEIDEYQKYLEKLVKTGNTYKTTITIQIANSNLEKENLPNNNIYYTKFNTQVIQELEANNKLVLNEGDIITVKTENTNLTISQSLRNFIYRVTGNESGIVTAEVTGMITTTGN